MNKTKTAQENLRKLKDIAILLYGFLLGGLLGLALMILK